MRFFVIFISLLLLFAPPKSHALEDFSSEYDVTYKVNADGKTVVTFDVTLENKTPQFYASSYRIDLGLEHITDIHAFDFNAGIVPTLVKNQRGSSIIVDFNKKVVGLKNKIHFTLTFQTDEIAKKVGSIWEINIPGISHQEDFTNFNVSLSVPEFLGNPSYIKPNVVAKKSSPFVYEFTKKDLGKSGISLSFGSEQIYDFSLTYHLENKNLFASNQEIALPPNTNYQEIFISDISLKPQSVVKDKDGNWLARYTLSPSEKKNVILKGKVKVFIEPKKQLESRDQLASYTRNAKYWETNPQLIELAKSLKTPQRIYEYVVNKLTYDFSRVEDEKPRLGAAYALTNPDSAVCLEFTDLFITLARAAGIPAREVDGFAYTQNAKQRPLSLQKDILHAWPEYYDMDLQTWIMVDPTWGNTTGGVDYFHKFDFDHVAFVIKGFDSEYPIPAGGYKLSNSQKDVVVKPIDGILTKTTRIDTIPVTQAKVLFSPILLVFFIPIIGGGIFLGICSFFLSKVAGAAGNLSFFRQKG